MHTGGPGGSGQSAGCESKDIEAGVVVSTAIGEGGEDKETTIVEVKKSYRKKKERKRTRGVNEYWADVRGVTGERESME